VAQKEPGTLDQISDEEANTVEVAMNGSPQELGKTFKYR
jgi:hypothetical protein